MSNKYWKEELNKNNEPLYVLYFTPYYEEEELIRFSMNKDGDYIYASELLKVESDYLDYFYCDETTPIEQAKQICEEMIEEYYEDQISSYEELLKKFKEE